MKRMNPTPLSAVTVLNSLVFDSIRYLSCGCRYINGLLGLMDFVRQFRIILLSLVIIAEWMGVVLVAAGS